MNQTPGRVCGRLRLCRCPKGAAASREGSGINASGDAEAKEVASKWEKAKSEKRKVESGMWNVECGMWNVECGMWKVESGKWKVEMGAVNN
jgi:uncharacterized cupin superfamily protein